MSLKGYRLHFTCISMFSIVCWLFFFFLTSSKTIYNEYNSLRVITNKPNCSALLSPTVDFGIVRDAENWKYPKEDSISELKLTNEIKNDCDNFLRKKGYFLSTNDDDERQFSVAFTIITFKNAIQVERLLRLIYRPWNYYCIHIDADADKNFYNAIEELTLCLKNSFGNIINTRNQVNVHWGKMSVLKADLNCMKELYLRFKSWKYLINLTGQEFPLKTNRELVGILKAFNGANNIDGTYTRRNEERIPTVKMPFPLIWYKGAVHITASREFIDYIFESPKVEMILNALEDYDFADEQFFSTLNFNPQLRIPGSFIGDPDEQTGPNEYKLKFLTRLKNWGSLPCLSQKKVRDICIWGVSDLPTLVESKHLFANKFYEDFQPMTIRCLEEWYYEKVRNEAPLNKGSFNVSYYKSMLFVINQFQPSKYR